MPRDPAPPLDIVPAPLRPASAALAARRCEPCGLAPRCDFGGLEGPVAETVRTRKLTRRLAEGEPLFTQGEENSGLHCVASGLIGLRMVHANGTDVLLGLAYPGETLGFRSFLANGAHQTNAVALQPTTVCTLLRREAMRLTQEAPALYNQLVRHCIVAIDGAHQTMLRAAASSNRARLCHLLYQLLCTHGGVAGGGHAEALEGPVSARLPISRADLAGMLGIEPESVSRIIRRLTVDGLARFSGRHVTVPSLSALAAAALAEAGKRSGF